MSNLLGLDVLPLLVCRLRLRSDLPGVNQYLLLPGLWSLVYVLLSHLNLELLSHVWNALVEPDLVPVSQVPISQSVHRRTELLLVVIYNGGLHALHRALQELHLEY